MSQQPDRRRLRLFVGRGVFACLALLFVLGALPGQADAGNYYLKDLEQFTKRDAIALSKMGIETTEQFLIVAKTADGRARLAARLRWPKTKLHEFAQDCEFLQINGVGPKVVKLLKEAGVTDVEDLATRDPINLHKRLEFVNQTMEITGIDPPLHMVDRWIQQAPKVKYLED